MAIQSRVSQDRRSSSRIIERLDCLFSYEDSAHKAVIVNLSQKGATLSSGTRIPTGDIIGITIPTEQLNKKIKLSGKVMRSTRISNDHGLKYRSVVQFSHTPLDLSNLVAKLYAKYF